MQAIYAALGRGHQFFYVWRHFTRLVRNTLHDEKKQMKKISLFLKKRISPQERNEYNWNQASSLILMTWCKHCEGRNQKLDNSYQIQLKRFLKSSIRTKKLQKYIKWKQLKAIFIVSLVWEKRDHRWKNILAQNKCLKARSLLVLTLQSGTYV